ncbi:MAG: hypothetical protein ABJP48_04855 [Erythrobacter sp.]
MLKIHTACALACALIASPAWAEDEKKPEESAPFAAATPIEEGKLAKIAGREDLNQVTQANQQNAVGGNNVGDNSTTGTIDISDNAFSNTTGFTILNANTGNNVAINASIQVNIALPSQ